MSFTEPEYEVEEKKITTIFVAEKSSSESEEPPMEEWSSLYDIHNQTSTMIKHGLSVKGLYDPGSGEVCAKYIAQSDSDVFRHPYYNYPAVADPGIIKSLLDPPPNPPPFPNDGKELYLDLCEKANLCPIRLIYERFLYPEINLSYYGISCSGIRPMAIALERNEFVKKLCLADNFLDFDACYHLGEMFKINSTIEELDLEGCRINQYGLLRMAENRPRWKLMEEAYVQQLEGEIHFNTTLRVINLSRNELGDEGGTLFAKMIELGARSTHIELRHNQLGTNTLLGLAEAFMVNCRVIYLDISWNPLTNIGAVVNFLNSLAVASDRLQELNLSFLGWDNERVAQAISEVIKIPSLRILKLNDNRFNDESAQILVKGLPQSKLVTYDLSNNCFSPAGACTLLRIMLRRTVKLKNLLLDHICVNRNFISILKNVQKMKIRKNFRITFDKVLHDWVAVGEDPRRLVLRRGDYMGRSRKVPKDVPLFLLSLSWAVENEGGYIRAKEFVVMMKDRKMPVNDDWVAGLIDAFPGPVIDQKTTVDARRMRDYMRRLWPEMKLPDDWVAPIMIRVDVKRKKKVVKTQSEVMREKKQEKKEKKGGAKKK